MEPLGASVAAENGARAVAVLATLATGAVLLVPGAVPRLVTVAVLLLLVGWAWRSSSAAALDVASIAVLIHVAVGVGLLGLWPLPAVVAVGIAAVAAVRSPRWALWRAWLRRGSASPETPWLLLATVLVTAAALTAWQALFDGTLPPAYREAAQGRSAWVVVVAAAGFALVNAAVEEAIFRGVLQTALHRLVRPVPAIALQAVAFGLLHVVGVPTGLVGAVMAGSWGALLGVLRYRTRGILAPYVAHVAADLTIVLMLLPTLW